MTPTPLSESENRLQFLRRRSHERRPRVRRGVALLPSLFTMGNMFCGYACIVYSLRGDFESAAPYIGISIVLDMLDGRIPRLTGTSSEFGLQLDSLADAISFGIAPAIMSYAWGLYPLGRLGMFSGFLFVSAAALRLERFNIQSADRGGGDPRGDGVPAVGRHHGLPRCAPGARDGPDPGAADGEHHPLPQLQNDRSADAAAVFGAVSHRARHHGHRDAPQVRTRRHGLRLPGLRVRGAGDDALAATRPSGAPRH